jgi:hypothetical protein
MAVPVSLLVNFFAGFTEMCQVNADCDQTTEKANLASQVTQNKSLILIQSLTCLPPAIRVLSPGETIVRDGGGHVPLVVENREGVFSRYPKNKLAHGVSQTEEEHAYARKYTIRWPNGRSFWT